MRASDLIEDLIRQIDMYGDHEVYTIHGPSGMSDRLGSVHYDIIEDHSCTEGVLCDRPIGYQYYWIYIGDCCEY